jgi:predicted RNA-binding Zn-ribbon protein involved in translation (DUF1610 family)
MNMRSEFVNEDGQFYYGKISPGSFADGVECPKCGLIYVILATDDIKHHEFKPIPVTGTVDSYCPCCGTNLRNYIRKNNPTVAG